MQIVDDLTYENISVWKLLFIALSKLNCSEKDYLFGVMRQKQNKSYDPRHWIIDGVVWPLGNS